MLGEMKGLLDKKLAPWRLVEGNSAEFPLWPPLTWDLQADDNHPDSSWRHFHPSDSAATLVR